MNQLILTGAVAAEPRRRDGLAQPAVAFRLAVAREDDASEPLHMDVVCVQELAGFAFGLEPGDHLGVAGRLDHNEWVGDDGIPPGPLGRPRPKLIVLGSTKRAA